MINKVRLIWNSCSTLSDFLFANKGWTDPARKRRTDPIVRFYGVFLSHPFDEIIFSAYELYADFSPKHESQLKDIQQPKKDSQKDNSLPKDESSNTEDLQQGESSRKESKDSIKIDDNSGKQEESSRKKEDKPQENDQSSSKEHSSLEGDSSKREKGSGKRRIKSRAKADESSGMAKRFKETFSRPDVRVHFIGVWCVPTIIVVFMGLYPHLKQGYRLFRWRDPRKEPSWDRQL